MMYRPKTKAPGLVLLLLLFLFVSCGPKRPQLSDRPIVVLTFDDAVKSHLTNVAPLLKAYDFDATFFVTYAWMKDSTNFLTWSDMRALHEMGFEIGNHSWTHADFSQPKQAFELEGELGLMEWMLARNGVPKPISYAHTGNSFGPEVIEALNNRGYLLARRGKQPEVEYGQLDPGPGYDPESHHPLLIPTTIDCYPDLDLETFKKSMKSVPGYKIAILQFHGVPDPVHPWVSTTPDQFSQYMDYLKEQDYQVIAVRDLKNYIPELLPNDPMLSSRYPDRHVDSLNWPAEVVSSRNDISYWLNLMRRHKFSHEEMAHVLGLSRDSIKLLKKQVPFDLVPITNKIEVHPFPGGRHPRINFKEGMLSPMRGTKLSIFLPWSENDFVVLDVPEAVTTQYGLTFLGHKHIPTVFDFEQIPITNTDWTKDKNGNWKNLWKLPNNMEIGAKVMPGQDRVMMKMWLTNRTSDTLFTGLQSQVCVMLGQTKSFAAQTNSNKLLTCPIVAVESEEEDHWVITGWEGCSRPWGNEDCPCLHADPVFPDCPPGKTVAINGILWFYEGAEVEKEISQKQEEYDWL